jgi:DNA-directed RNA polymerase specialized sigma24 family protein
MMPASVVGLDSLSLDSQNFDVQGLGVQGLGVKSLELHAHAEELPWERSEYEEPDEDTEICLYRGRTVNVLKRYLRLSIQTGRLPSLLGSLHFRARNSSYTLHTFEDAVIFVLDVERCLEELDSGAQDVIARVILQEHTVDYVARQMHCRARSMERKLQEAVDELTKHLLQRGILSRSRVSSKTCQEAKQGVFPLSDWKEGE